MTLFEAESEAVVPLLTAMMIAFLAALLVAAMTAPKPLARVLLAARTVALSMVVFGLVVVGAYMLPLVLGRP